MGKRAYKAKKFKPVICRDCGMASEPGDRFWHRRCPRCRLDRAEARRKETGERLLERAKDAGTEDRDGQTFKVVKLPPKRR